MYSNEINSKRNELEQKWTRNGMKMKSKQNEFETKWIRNRMNSNRD